MNPVSAKIISGIIALAMLMLFNSPLYLALFYIFFRPLVQPFATFHYRLVGQVPVTAIFPVILILAAFWHATFSRDNKLLPPNVLPLYILIYFSFCSFLNTMNFMVSFGEELKILSGIAIYLLVFNAIHSRQDARKVLYGLVITSILPMLYGYYQFITHTGHIYKRQLGYQVTGLRIDSLIGEYNSYGIFLAMSIFAALMLLLQEESRKRKFLLLILITSMVVSSILALNRGSWISLAAGFAFSIPFYWRKIKLRWFLVASMIITLCFSGMIVNRFEVLGQKKNGRPQNTFMGRIDYWKNILPLIKMHALVGHGIGMSTYVTEKYLKNPSPPHNDYLRLALETGIPSSLLYIFFLLREFWSNILLARKKENWQINFPMLVAIVYFGIISTIQNNVGAIIVFSMFFSLVGVSRKWNLLKE